MLSDAARFLLFRSHDRLDHLQRHFYHRTSLCDRPKILGMTASPIDSRKGLNQTEDITTILDAEMVTAPPETWEELRCVHIKRRVRGVA